MTIALQQPARAPDQVREYVLSDKHFAAIASLVRGEVGINLTEAKRDLVYSRLVKRIRALRLPDFGDYIALVGSPDGAEERRELISAITTNVTNFYREPHHFEHLEQALVPTLIERTTRREPVRIWSAGCSDGREPYTIACTLLKAIPDAARQNVKILATDIDHNSLDTAKAGRYSAEMVSKMPPAVRDKFFTRVGDEAEARDALRDLITFRILNLLHDYPFKLKFDAIFCRNVLIYFTPELQAQIIAKFCAFLKPDGFLYIGHSERVSGPATSKLEQVGITTYKHTASGGIR